MNLDARNPRPYISCVQTASVQQSDRCYSGKISIPNCSIRNCNVLASLWALDGQKSRRQVLLASTDNQWLSN